IGDFGRPHRLIPRRRLILYLLSARLVIVRVALCGCVVAPVGPAAACRWAGAGPEDPSTFPAVKAGRIGARQPACQTFPVRLPSSAMINRSDIIWLGVAAGVMGSL